jgi:hypothetical protein
MAQQQQTRRELSIDKADRLITDLETIEDRVTMAIMDATALRDELRHTGEHPGEDFDPAVHRQLLETVRLLQQRTQDPSIRLDLDRIARILSAVANG